MDKAIEEGAGGEHHGAAGEEAPIGQAKAAHASPVPDEIIGLAFDDGKIGLGIERGLHGAGIELAIGLGPRPPHRRPLAPVQHAELNAALIGHPAHQAVQGIDLAHQMPLAQPTDRRIAGHRPNGRPGMGDQRRGRACAGSGGGGLAPRMPTPHDDHVESGGKALRTHERFILALVHAPAARGFGMK